MKKTKAILGLLLLTLFFGFTATSCGDDDDNNKIDYIEFNQLPEPARSFINTYFADAEIARVIYDATEAQAEYEVDFRNGAEVDFTVDGIWKDVKAAVGSAVPAGIIPINIVNYVSNNYATAYIVEISKEVYGYDVDLNTGIDLEFDKDGNFLRIS